MNLKYKEYNDKRKQYHKEYRQKRKPIAKEYAKEYRKRRTFKMLAYSMNHWYKNGIVTPFDLWKIAKKQKLICPFTGKKLTQYNMSIDHITPKSKGGLNIPSNIRLVLKSVNMAKQAMTDEEFVNLCRGVVNYDGGGTTPPTV